MPRPKKVPQPRNSELAKPWFSEERFLIRIQKLGYLNDFSLFRRKIVLGDRVHDIDDTLATVMWRFTMWVSVLNSTDNFIENSSPVYVGPGVDPATEDLRAVLHLLNLRTPEVPEDPLEGDELNVLSQLFARHLHVLSLFAGESE